MVAMAVVASQQFMCFSESNWRIRTKPCFPLPHFNTILLRSRNKIQLPLISCSSSSQTPQTDTQTAESCVNLGLQLFSKGRVFIIIFNFFFLCIQTMMFKWGIQSSVYLLIMDYFFRLKML